MPAALLMRKSLVSRASLVRRCVRCTCAFFVFVILSPLLVHVSSPAFRVVRVPCSAIASSLASPFWSHYRSDVKLSRANANHSHVLPLFLPVCLPSRPWVFHPVLCFIFRHRTRSRAACCFSNPLTEPFRPSRSTCTPKIGARYCR